ncbi:spore germination protein [Gottfriedia acidiceleris]|uniref:Spore germination protein n=1 Tax=Gottfriedia acidiceleris TaxID=371036 RepID=A0ABY4JIQ8_9BACI|nr:spore germination protein [Gottfriedia acidiceleris]UPM53347.1 spore germination protein [Gottfriedia acidiceleris]
MEVNEKTSMLDEVKSSFQSSSDFKYKKYSTGEVTLHLFYLDTMIDSEVIQTHILERVLSKDDSDRIKTTILNTEDANTLDECIQFILSGNVIVFNDNNKSKAKSYSVPSNNSDRSISESLTETVSLGAHDSFVESLNINSTLIRKRLRTKELIIKKMAVGKKYPVSISIFYLNDITPQTMIETIEQKLKELESSGKVEPERMIESVHIQNIIEEYPSSPFPQVMFTERPDRTVRHLLIGKPAIMIDNDPNALLFPCDIYGYFRSVDDFNFRWLFGIFFYCLRMVAFWIAVLLPSIYIAITTYHSNILPISIFYTLKLSIENVPLPPIIEAFSMIIILELLKEAPLRLPNPIGSTIGTVGAIVLGTSIVQTNLISNSMVVVIAFTAVASFSLPSREMSIASRIMGIPLLVLSSFFGFIGISLGIFMILAHLSKIRAFSYRYVENPGFSEFVLLKNRKGKQHDQ